jgi:hypothetical protein
MTIGELAFHLINFFLPRAYIICALRVYSANVLAQVDIVGVNILWSPVRVITAADMPLLQNACCKADLQSSEVYIELV